MGMRPEEGFLWPPGYPYFLAGLTTLFGRSETIPRLVQVLISCGTLLLVFGITSRLYDRRAGLTAAAIFAVYPNVVAYTHYIWPETVFLGLFLLSFYLLVRRPKVEMASAATAGLVFGIAALVKAIALPFAVLVSLWIAGFGAREPGPSGATSAPARAAGLFLVATLSVVLLGSIDGWVKYDRVFPGHATAGRNLYLGTTLVPPTSWDAGMGARRKTAYRRGGRPLCAEANVIDNDRCETRAALAFMAAHPGLMIARVPTKLADLLTPTSFVVRHLRFNKYAHRFTRNERRVLIYVIVLSFMAVAALGTVGALLLPAGPGRLLILAFFAYLLVVHAVTFGTSRFRFSAEPLLIMTAAPLLRPGIEQAVRRAGGVRLGAAVGLVALLCLAWWSRWPAVFGRLPG